MIPDDAVIRKVFSEMDTRERGFLPIKSFMFFLSGWVFLSDDELQAIGSSTDKDGDGKISYEEFRDFCQQHHGLSDEFALHQPGRSRAAGR